MVYVPMEASTGSTETFCPESAGSAAVPLVADFLRHQTLTSYFFIRTFVLFQEFKIFQIRYVVPVILKVTVYFTLK